MARIPLPSAGRLKDILEAGQANAAQAPVAWVTAAFPVELVRAMGFHPYYPENFGAAAAAKKATAALSRAAESRGYSSDLCGYARAGLGDCLGEDHPVGAMTKPAVILGANNQCGTLGRWFEAAARDFGVPYFLLDFPPVFGGVGEPVRGYLRAQMLELAGFLARHGGEDLDRDRLAGIIDLANAAGGLWRQVLDLAKGRPAPFGFFDACVYMAAMVTLRGTQAAVDYYRLLLADLGELAAGGYAAVPGERYKVYWDHIPVWPRLSWAAGVFAGHGVLAAVSQYTEDWYRRFDPVRPLESLGEEYALAFVNRDFEERLARKMRLGADFGVDGFVLLSNRSCKATSVGLYDKQRELTRRTGLPAVVLEADMADPAFFDEARLTERLEVFFDLLGRAKAP
ncbi:MAG: 2-hydroxyacyl-CoA dehydratase family protein [Peptococcaceae bacterium]|jgi:benzoyl-CoA reductase/2-hydroxyglutaryl-CoA dehydratase subunit BcrC/BadD/HgdB|nr:2-hydroxyacyl-CoA dehydratase family protein [Peptococcaceae bacterium]